MKAIEVKIKNGGEGYSPDTSCNFSDGTAGCIHALGKPTVVDGKITAVEITRAGSGYEKPAPKINFVDPNGGHGAEGEVVIG